MSTTLTIWPYHYASCLCKVWAISSATGAQAAVYKTLPRLVGQACTNCRKRKIRCDGSKPICSQCRQSLDSFGDCEYTDIAGLTQRQILEEQIAVLEARLEVLQNPAQSGSLNLYDPYNPASTSRAVAQSTADETVSLDHTLIRTFLLHASEVGFFLHPDRLEALLLSSGEDSSSLSPALLNVVRLLGCHFSSSASIKTSEPVFASRAQSMMVADPPKALVERIQASVLLANWFFRNARPLEGQYQISTGVSLVLSAGLQRIFSDISYPGRGTGPAPQQSRDTLAEGEKLNAFWTVLILDNCWTTTDGSPANMPHGTQGFNVDAPFPLHITDYSQDSIPSGRDTIRQFLAGGENDAQSPLALHAKASILYHMSGQLSRQFHANMPPAEMAQLLSAVTTLERSITRFLRGLPPVDQNLLVVHTLAHAATIHLYAPFIAQNSEYYAKAIASAKSIVQILNSLGQVTSVDPILASLWTAACRLLISDLGRDRARARTPFGRGHARDDPRAFIETLLRIMSTLAPGCPLMGLHRSQLVDAYSAL